MSDEPAKGLAVRGSITPDSARNQHGRIVRTPEQMEEDHHAAELKSRGMSYREIAQQTGCSVSAAYNRVQRAIADIPKEGTETLRAMEVLKLDQRERITLGILAKITPKTSQTGSVVTMEVRQEDGSFREVMVEDYDVKLRALATLNKISERRAKLMGLDSPIKVESTSVVYDGATIEGQVEQLRRLFEQVGSSEVLLD